MKPNEPRRWNAAACRNLRGLLEAMPACQVVVSSSWRLRLTLEQLREAFAYLGLSPDRLLAVTPHLPGESRGAEIAAWLAHHPETATFAILDDDGGMGLLAHRWVRVNFRFGLRPVDCQAIVTLLSP